MDLGDGDGLPRVGEHRGDADPDCLVVEVVRLGTFSCSRASHKLLRDLRVETAHTKGKSVHQQ